MLSAEHKHLSSLLIALIILCCVSFLVIYYKIDEDYANQSGDFAALQQRFDILQAEADQMMSQPGAAPTQAMPLNPASPSATTSPSYVMPSPALPNNY